VLLGDPDLLGYFSKNQCVLFKGNVYEIFCNDLWGGVL
jgi:hypothetical protein